MIEAFAHETTFPHVHPHSHFSAMEDLALTVLFLAIVYLVGWMALSLARKYRSNR
jgi:hypothetical protein